MALFIIKLLSFIEDNVKLNRNFTSVVSVDVDAVSAHV